MGDDEARRDPHVSQSDAFTMALERDPGLRATIVAVTTLDRSPDWERLVDRFDRATRAFPAFRERLVPTPLGLAPPAWAHDEDFDLSWHLRRLRLAEGAGTADLLDFARTAAMDAFDHDRPLWEFTLVEGLEGGRAALVLKVHHALTDGIGGVQIAAHVVDLDRDGVELGPLPDAPSGRTARPFESLAEAVGHDLRAAVDVGSGLVRAAPAAALAALRDPWGAVTGVAGELASAARMVRPVTSTASPVMVERGLIRHFEVLDVDLEALRRGAARAGATVNDAFLAGIAEGLRRYHLVHGAEADELRVTMPVSIRRPDDEMGGNHVSLVRFDLPLDVEDPTERLRRIHEIADRQRHEPAIEHSEAIAALLNLLPVGVTAGMLRHVDLLVSNVPGLDVEVYVAGAKVEAFHAFGATLGSAANITLMSYAGTCHLGINTDTAAVRDPAELVRCLRAGFDEVAG